VEFIHQMGDIGYFIEAGHPATAGKRLTDGGRAPLIL
jgi:hypothetical protein